MALFSMPPVDLSNFCVEIEEVWELNGFGLSELIHSTNQSSARFIQTFEGFFARRMNDFRRHSLNVEKAVTIIRSHKGQIPIFLKSVMVLSTAGIWSAVWICLRLKDESIFVRKGKSLISYPMPS